MAEAAFGTLPLAPALEYARLLRENHALIAQGKGDTAEAEALAERMDEPWYALTTQEQKRLRGLSVDLYALHEATDATNELSVGEVAGWLQEFNEALGRYEIGNVDATLEFLRRPTPATVPRHTVRFLQARCWEKLGDHETSLLFMRQVERENPELPVDVLALLNGLEKNPRRLSAGGT